ncbi:MAG: hypothetical protein ACXVE1_01965 [Gaiellaceae bacterium]
MNEQHHSDGSDERGLDIIEERSLTTDIGVYAGPAIGAAAGWALAQYGPGSDDDATPQAEEPKEIILPPGTDRE